MEISERAMLADNRFREARKQLMRDGGGVRFHTHGSLLFRVGAGRDDGITTICGSSMAAMRGAWPL